MSEFIKVSPVEVMPGVHEFEECLCGNRPDMDGFYPCLGNGTVVEPVVAGSWDDEGRYLYACASCGRIIGPKGEVVGQVKDLDTMWRQIAEES